MTQQHIALNIAYRAEKEIEPGRKQLLDDCIQHIEHSWYGEELDQQRHLVGPV